MERHADDATRAAHRTAAARREDEEAFRAKLPKTLVMQEVASPKPTHILKRGQYDAPGDVVTAGVPDSLSPWPEGAPRNRLGLAQWLVAPSHPLTARVAVNHLWLRHFGEALVNDYIRCADWPVEQEPLEPRDGLGVQVVGRLVEQQQVGVLQGQLGQGQTAALAAREHGDQLEDVVA